MTQLFVFFAGAMVTAFLFWLSHLAWSGILSDIAELRRERAQDRRDQSALRRAMIILCDDILLLLRDMELDTAKQERKAHEVSRRLKSLEEERSKKPE